MSRLLNRSFRFPALAALVLTFGCAEDEVCDWEDNDRDGVIDEGYDADGDGWWACGLSAAHQA